MAQKCAHKGCGKLFTDPEEPPCVYHPGPPEFHEGLKGWKCCKPRVLTFDDFLDIPPCTTGRHSVVDDPRPEEEEKEEKKGLKLDSNAVPAPTRLPQVSSTQAVSKPATPAPPESESDSSDRPVPKDATCRRRGCGVKHSGNAGREGEICIHHPGAPIFHEGSKGYICCKRRVLEFDEFLKIEGCSEKRKHLFIGRAEKDAAAAADEEEHVKSVRHDFYQTPTTVHASFFLKKIIPPPTSKIDFSTTHVDVDLRTSDGKRYKCEIPLFSSIEPSNSSFKIMGTKIELELAKADGRGWPVLRADEPSTGEIIQSGRAGTA